MPSCLSADVHIHIIPRHAKDFEPIDESASPLLSRTAALAEQSAHTPHPRATVYTELDSKNLAQDFADAYAARPSRAERKAFEAEQRAKEEGKADAPFAGIEDERRPRSVDEMREEALRLSGLFPPENRCDFE